VRVTAATARRILRRQGMHPREIRAVLAANDPLLARRVLELHRERLEERLEEQRRLVATIERSLAGQPRPVPSGRSGEAASSTREATPFPCGRLPEVGKVRTLRQRPKGGHR
jgi:DNA-binding transcriptional MerR regulator